MAANYDQPDLVQKRVRFFDGQYLVDQDFVDEQKYHLDRGRRLAEALRITGVFYGLEVTVDSRTQLTVSKGMAIDAKGRQLILGADTQVPLEEYSRNKELSVHLGYRQLPVDPAAGDETGNERRFEERPEVVVSEIGSTEVDASAVRLATIDLPTEGLIRVFRNADPASLCVPGSVGIGSTAPPGGGDAIWWNRAIDVLGSGSAKLSVRATYSGGEIDARIMAYIGDWWGGKPGMTIGTKTAHPVNLATNSATRLTIDSAGKVGIGTPEPEHSLDVHGDLRVTEKSAVMAKFGDKDGDTVFKVGGRLKSAVANGGLWVSDNRFVGSHGGTDIVLWNNGKNLSLSPKGDVTIDGGIFTYDRWGRRVQILINNDANLDTGSVSFKRV